MRRLITLVAVSTIAVSAVQAQTCLGYSSLDKTHVNAGVNGWFGDNESAFGAQINMRHVGFGQNHFVSLGVATDKVKHADKSQLQLDAKIGIDETAGSFEWCPMVLIGYDKGPISGSHNLNLGGGIGLAHPMGGGSIEWIPFGSVQYVHEKSTADFAGTNISSSANIWVYGAGIGIRFPKGMQLSPQFTKTSVDGDKARFGATISFPFGHRM